jgi:predicted molibdopterin-dependent oxidoreductase YjgC
MGALPEPCAASAASDRRSPARWVDDHVERLGGWRLDFLGESVDIVIHPDDAAASGVADGDAVVVRSERGELTGIATVDSSIRAGAVSVPHGHQRANVNCLTCDDEIDAPTGMARYSGIPISLHPLILDRAVAEQGPRGSMPG